MSNQANHNSQFSTLNPQLTLNFQLTLNDFLLLKAKKSNFVLSIQILFVPLHSLNKTQLVP